jgi:uncharacterized protein (TIGR02996 family)
MHTTLAGLIQGCAEALDDNAPRLILADWLEDHGQPERAELVRVQCRLADWVPDWQERQTLIARQDALIATHRERWLGPLAKSCHRVEFVRGLCRLDMSGRNFTSKMFGERLTAHGPTALVEQVRLTDCLSLRAIASKPWLGLVPSLGLGQTIRGRIELEPLWKSPHTERLVNLDLSDNGLGPSDVQGLIAAPFFGRLARLALRNNALGEAGCESLLAAAPASLRDLDLAGNQLARSQIERLAAHRPAARIMNSLGMEFVRVPAGAFLMGSLEGDDGAGIDEYPLHPVTLTKPFWLGRFAVTQEQYHAVMRTNPASFNSAPLTTPVECVSYSDATNFCKRLSTGRSLKEAGRSYRLPTEAEWEHACRAGTFTAYFPGDEPSLHWMNYHGGGSGDAGLISPRRPLPVGSYPPNAFGLYDMHGNVWEWTSDFYLDNYAGHEPIDPTGPARGNLRVVRGGCWDAADICCRSAHRYGETPGRIDSFTGFRVVLVTAE